MGCWHAYAKLRLHTEQTLASFRCITADLGVLLRHFSMVVCNAYKTTELPRERAARIRRAANAAGGSTTSGGGPKPKGFNLNTYKLHALGDYPQAICDRGTTDNYTSQRVWNVHRPACIPLLLIGNHQCQVEVEHRSSKAIYQRINKHDPERDIGRMHRRREVLQYLANGGMGAPAPKAGGVNQGEHFKMSEGTSEHVNLSAFLTVPRGMAPDPAKKVHSSYPYGIYDA